MRGLQKAGGEVVKVWLESAMQRQSR